LLGAFALTDVSEFDIKFRKIASWYIEFGEMIGELWIKYDVFTFAVDKKIGFDKDLAEKKTRVPVLSFNGYQANKILVKVEKIIKRKIKYRFAQLGFYSKFNCDPDKNIYKSGDIFDKLDKWYGMRPDRLKYQNPTQ